MQPCPWKIINTSWAFAASAVGVASAASIISEIINDCACLISPEVWASGEGVAASAPRGAWRVIFINWAQSLHWDSPCLPAVQAPPLQTASLRPWPNWPNWPVGLPPQEAALYPRPRLPTRKPRCTVPASSHPRGHAEGHRMVRARGTCNPTVWPPPCCHPTVPKASGLDVTSTMCQVRW